MGEEDDAYKRHEIPQPTPDWERTRSLPDTPMQALMEAEAFAEPEVSVVEMLAMRDTIVDVFDTLTDQEAWIINALVVERMSIRSLARQLGTSKSTIFRIKEKGLEKMRNQLMDNPEIVSTLQGMGWDV